MTSPNGQKPTSRKILDAATQEIGKQEIPKGSNWGADVQKYLHSVGIDFPASWCMAFVYWCVNQSVVVNPLVKTGGVMRQWNESKALAVTDPQPGDIFIMDFGHGLGHTGIVEWIDGPVIHTIEGNSNDTGSREGFEVCKRVRPKSSIKGYLRIS